MSNTEAPIQIDLSKDIADQGLTLTPAEQTSFQDYLNTLKAEEQVGIIYLTKGEIQELKDIVQHNDVPAQEGFKEFIHEQKTEGLSVSDIIVMPEGTPNSIKEMLDVQMQDLESNAEEKLFGTEGIFSGLKRLSPTAKDHITSFLSISMINTGIGIMQEKISSGALKPDDINDIMKTGDELDAKFTAIKAVIDKTEATNNLDNSIASVVNISDGELNKIFMQADEGTKFFDGIISGEITEKNVEKILEEANVNRTTEIKVDLGPVGKKLNTSVKGFTDAIQALSPKQQEQIADVLQNPPLDGTNVAGTTSEGNNTSSEKPKKELTGFAKFIHDFIKGFINMFKEHTPEGTDKKGEKKEGEEKAEKPEERDTTEAARDFFRTKISEGDTTAFTLTQIQELFPENGELSQEAQDIIQTIQEIGGTESDFETEFNNLFQKVEGESKSKFEAFIIASEAFIIASEDNIIKEGETPGKNMLAVLKEYKKYRDGGTGELFSKYFKIGTPK